MSARTLKTRLSRLDGPKRAPRMVVVGTLPADEEAEADLLRSHGIGPDEAVMIIATGIPRSENGVEDRATA